MAAPMRQVSIRKYQFASLCIRRYSIPDKAKFIPKSPKKKRKSTFLDSLRVFVRAGAGGQGLVRHGGVGGNGGNVVVVAKEGETLLNTAERHPEKRFTAASGGNSRKHHLLGENGNTLKINIPVGVVVKSEDGRVIGDLSHPGQELVVANGGKGGNPSNNFLGQKGEAQTVILDLKLIADIGLVGFPNAGKSTFLSSVSRAKPKIAEYPFTTIRPQIGTMMFPDSRKITVADLPGLIEGAHFNHGMGHKFLKHIERTKLLLFIVDVGGFQLGVNYQHRTAFETVLLLIKELELYREDLMGKPAVLALNKIDIDGGQERAAEIIDLVNKIPASMELIDPQVRPERLVKFDEIFTISAKTGQTVPEMKHKLRKLLDIYADRAHYNHVSHDSEPSIPRNFDEQARSKLV